MKPIISNNWRNSLVLGLDEFEDLGGTTPEITIILCDRIISGLKKIKEKEESENLTEDEKYNVDSKLEENIDNFEFLKHLCDGTIPESEFENYAYNGDHEEMFNDYLSQLYDLGDERVTNKQNVVEKFIWIK